MQRITHIQLSTEAMKDLSQIISGKDTSPDYPFLKSNFLLTHIREPIRTMFQKVYQDNETGYTEVLRSPTYFITQRDEIIWELIANVNDAAVRSKVAEVAVNIFFTEMEDDIALAIIDNGPGLSSFFAKNSAAKEHAESNHGFIEFAKLIEKVSTSNDSSEKKGIAGGTAKNSGVIINFLERTGGGQYEMGNLSDLRSSLTHQTTYGLTLEDMKALPEKGTAVLLRSKKHKESTIDEIIRSDFLIGTREYEYREHLIELTKPSDTESILETLILPDIVIETEEDSIEEPEATLGRLDLTLGAIETRIEMVSENPSEEKPDEELIKQTASLDSDFETRIELDSEKLLETKSGETLIELVSPFDPVLYSLEEKHSETLIELAGIDESQPIKSSIIPETPSEITEEKIQQLTVDEKQKLLEIRRTIQQELDSCCLSLFANRPLKLAEIKCIDSILSSNSLAVEYSEQWPKFRKSLKSVIEKRAILPSPPTSPLSLLYFNILRHKNTLSDHRTQKQTNTPRI